MREEYSEFNQQIKDFSSEFNLRNNSISEENVTGQERIKFLLQIYSSLLILVSKHEKHSIYSTQFSSIEFMLV